MQRVLLMTGAVILGGCAGPPHEDRDFVPPDIHMDQVQLQTFQGGQTRAVLTAPHLEMMRHTGNFSLWDASVRLESQQLTVAAPRVDGNLNTGVLEGSGGLLVRSDQGVTGKTPRATFEQAAGPQGVAHSDAGVTLDDPRFTLEAQGFSVDFAAQQAVFDAPVTRSR